MSDSHLIACLAENSFETKYRSPTSLKQRVHVTQPMRNSAPSRLQNIEDFYLVESYSSLCGSKARSLTDLFVFDRDVRCCGAAHRNQCVCSRLHQNSSTISDEMPLPNCQTDEDAPDMGQSCDRNEEVFQNTDLFVMTDVLESLEVDVFQQNHVAENKTEETSTEITSNANERRSSCPQQVIRSLSDSSCDGKPARKLLRRKSVHFADTKGFDLEIKIPFCRELDETNTPPRLLEALEKVRAEIHGKNGHQTSQVCRFTGEVTCFSLTPQFPQPFLDHNFQRRVASQMVCLETVAMIPNSRSLTGVIRVVNIHFEKQVSVRYSTDQWRSHTDIPACYVASQHESNQDQFSFHLVAPESISGGDKIEFAIRYRLPSNRQEFWDNNNGTNYVIICVEHNVSPSDDGMLT